MTADTVCETFFAASHETLLPHPHRLVRRRHEGGSALFRTVIRAFVTAKTVPIVSLLTARLTIPSLETCTRSFDTNPVTTAPVLADSFLASGTVPPFITCTLGHSPLSRFVRWGKVEALAVNALAGALWYLAHVSPPALVTLTLSRHTNTVMIATKRCAIGLKLSGLEGYREPTITDVG